MITSFDDFPIHPTSAPINETGSSDPNHYDRYFFNGYRQDGSIFFAVAMGLYPNRHIADASFSVVVEGREQISVHASCRANSDRMHANKVGPLQIQVIRPMQEHHILVDTPEHGLKADLRFIARSAPIQEPHFLLKAGQRTIFDYTRLTQFGHWSGWIEVDGLRHMIEQSNTPGSRDRSWGVRPIGPASDMGAPIGERQFYWLWAPINFGDFATHFDINEDSSGRRWHQSGFVLPDGDSPAKIVDAVDYTVKWRLGTRWAQTFSLRLGSSPTDQTIELTPLFEFHMLGLGYGHPLWGHGLWKGEVAVFGERWSLPVPDPCNPQHIHIQALVRARMGEHQGIGILEQLVLGAHTPTGLTGIVDPA